MRDTLTLLGVSLRSDIFSELDAAHQLPSSRVEMLQQKIDSEPEKTIRKRLRRHLRRTKKCVQSTLQVKQEMQVLKDAKEEILMLLERSIRTGKPLAIQ